ncbi:hypothetical protein Tco_0111575 [Tanacetum coccineum]
MEEVSRQEVLLNLQCRQSGIQRILAGFQQHSAPDYCSSTVAIFLLVLSVSSWYQSSGLRDLDQIEDRIGPKYRTEDLDCPKNDKREETPEQSETYEHKNAHIPAAMANEIKKMISQEIAKAQAAALSYLKEYFANVLRCRAKEWWNYTLAAKGPTVSRNMSWNEFKELFLQKFSPQAELKNIRRDFLSVTPRQGGNARRKQEWISSQHMVSI